MIYVYTENITSRFTYVCDFIFTTVLKTEYKLIDNLQPFDSNKLILSYSRESHQNFFHVFPHGLLFEKGIRELKLNVSIYKDLFVFFETGQGNLPFDIFSMVFYYISRYEEYHNFKADEHQRFPVEESSAFKNGILRFPFIDKAIWIFGNLLCEWNPEIRISKPVFNYHSTIDVDNAFYVKGKSLSRILGALTKDILNFNFNKIRRRISVMLSLQKDPFDFYDDQIEISKKYNTSLTYFLLYAEKGEFDRSLQPKNSTFEKLIDKLHLTSTLGIHPSYFSSDYPSLMKNEISSLRGSIRKISNSRQHFLRLRFPDTFNELKENLITDDFSIGFSNRNGFRAGTAYPFYFFDLKTEEATTLRLHPFHVMDSVFYDHEKKNPAEAWNEIKEIVNQIMLSGGTFISVWHDRAFDELSHPGWKDCYIKLHEYCVNGSASRA